MWCNYSNVLYVFIYCLFAYIYIFLINTLINILIILWINMNVWGNCIVHVNSILFIWLWVNKIGKIRRKNRKKPLQYWLAYIQRVIRCHLILKTFYLFFRVGSEKLQFQITLIANSLMLDLNVGVLLFTYSAVIFPYQQR